MIKRPKHSDEIVEYARVGARAQIQTILRLFPELLDELVAESRPVVTGAVPLNESTLGETLTPKQRKLRKHALEHWDKTTNGSGKLKGLSLLSALRSVLTDTLQTNSDLQAALAAGGYKHKGSSTLSTRIGQELNDLEKRGYAVRHKAPKGKGSGKGKYMWQRGQGGVE